MGVSLTQQKILIGQKPLESRVYSAPDSTLSLKGSNALTWFPTTSTGMGFIGPVSNKFLSLFPASVHDVISCPYLQPKAPVEKTLSTPNSPLLTHRSSSLERSNIYTNQQQQQQKVLWHNLTTSDSVLCLRRRVLIVWISFFFLQMTLSRQKSDMSHDRERPFMAVKRFHQQQQQQQRHLVSSQQVSCCFLDLKHLHF